MVASSVRLLLSSYDVRYSERKNRARGEKQPFDPPHRRPIVVKLRGMRWRHLPAQGADIPHSGEILR